MTDPTDRQVLDTFPNAPIDHDNKEYYHRGEWPGHRVPHDVPAPRRHGSRRGLQHPHPVVLVDLVEQPGLRASATVVGARNEDIRIGMPIELTWIDRAGEPLPAFRPAP